MTVPSTPGEDLRMQSKRNQGYCGVKDLWNRLVLSREKKVTWQISCRQR